MLLDVLQHTCILFMEIPESWINTRVREIRLDKPGIFEGLDREMHAQYTIKPFPSAVE
jgi:hypothetical protein